MEKKRYFSLMNDIFARIFINLFSCSSMIFLFKSPSKHQHVQHLAAGMMQLSRHQFYANPNKCEFGKTKVAYLGLQRLGWQLIRKRLKLYRSGGVAFTKEGYNLQVKFWMMARPTWGTLWTRGNWCKKGEWWFLTTPLSFLNYRMCTTIQQLESIRRT